MKKKIFKLLTGMLLSCALAGSTVAVQAEEAGTDTVKSYLTGEDVSVGIGHRRPIAVMLGNDTNGQLHRAELRTQESFMKHR